MNGIIRWKEVDYKKVIDTTQKVLYYVRYGVLDKGIDLVKAITISSIINMIFETLKYYNLRVLPQNSVFLALTLVSLVLVLRKVFKYRKLYDENKFYVIPYVVGEIILLALVVKPLNASLPTEIVKDAIPLFIAITLTRVKK
jgi:hypothetical protein